MIDCAGIKHLGIQVNSTQNVTTLLNMRVAFVTAQMAQSDSSQDEVEQEEDGGPTKPKRSKPDEGGQEDMVLRPVKLSRSDLYRAPTAEELNQLKEAESLFHCSLLKMQVRLIQRCGCAFSPLAFWNETEGIGKEWR